MCHVLWLTSFVIASFWFNSHFETGVNETTVIAGNRVFTRETRTESQPAVLCRIPYVNRLFREVGYSREQWSLGTAVVGAAAAHEDLKPAPELAPFPTEEQSVPELPAFKPNEKPASDPPCHAEILRAMPPVRSCPFVYQEYRDDIEITTEKLVDRLNPVRFYPMVGPAQLHQVHWKCTVTFTETLEGSTPFNFTLKRRRSEVVYIDKDSLCACGPQNAPADPKLGGVCALPSMALRDSSPVRQINPPDVLVLKAGRLYSKQVGECERARTNIDGQHLVRPDGTIHLGLLGAVNVGSMSAGQAKRVIENHLAQYFVEPQVAVEITSLSSRQVYVIEESEGHVITLPFQSAMTVVDALAATALCKSRTPAKVWIARPNTSNTLEVDWRAIVETGRTETNYALLSGDRLHVWFAKPEHRVRACWDERVHTCDDLAHPGTKLSMLKGSLYLFDRESNETVEATARIVVEAFNKCDQRLAQWKFDPESLAKLKRKDLIGIGYTLALPVESNCLNAGDIKLTVTYRPEGGVACAEESRWQNPGLNGTEVVGNRIRAGFGQGAINASGVVQAAHAAPRPFPDVIANTPVMKQVQLGVVIANVDSSALDKLRLDLTGKDGARHSILRDGERVHEVLQALRKQGVAKILAEPRVVTLSGRPAQIVSGGEMPMLTTSGQGTATVSYKQFGTVLNLLPIVDNDGKIVLEVRPEVTNVERRVIVEAINTRGAQVTVKLDAGQTLAIVLPGTDKRKNQDLVILVTPTLVEPTVPTTDAPASKQMTLSQVIALAKRSIADDIIIRQMELTESVFNLSVDDIVYLHDAGVSDAVIRAMQGTRVNSNRSSYEPMIRMEQRMIDSETLRQRHDELRKFWMPEQPSHLRPY